MFNIAKTYAAGLVAKFRDEEEGLALTEYLILLGLLTAAVIGAVLLFGQGLATTWGTWAEWIGNLQGAPT